MSWATLCAFYLPLALVFCGARFLARGRGAGAATALAATYSNTVFMGVPVLVQVLGPDCLQFAYPVIAFHSLFCFTLYHLGDDEAPGRPPWRGAGRAGILPGRHQCRLRGQPVRRRRADRQRGDPVVESSVGGDGSGVVVAAASLSANP
ncbi:hypothetical protein [Massilia brevitalea]|uniref:hypothetical protein n=1 Tax=Massilia brevitalea TaxID=442526 RepID=UPI002738B1A7|nr:hypothetical protein [Massilia brevitalea]